MGGEFSSNSCNSYELEKKVDIPAGLSLHRTCWELHDAVNSADQSEVSVFVFSAESDERNAVGKNWQKFGGNSAKVLKMLRHPSVVRFHDVCEMSEALWIVTERVTPVTLVIDTLTPFEITLGLYSVIEALSFLHTKAGLCHNNVCLESIFVTDGGLWKLGAMECSCRFNDASVDFLQSCKAFRSPQAILPDEQMTKTANELNGCIRDAFALCQLVQYLSEYLAALGDVVNRFHARIEKDLLCSSSSNKMLHLSVLLEDDFFRNELVSILLFIKNLTLKSEQERAEFFLNLAPNLYKLPVHVVGMRLVKPLLSRFVVLDKAACEYFLPHLLTPCSGNVRPDVYVEDSINPIFPRSLYQKYVLPEIYKIFHVRDAHVRSVLLYHFEQYVGLFDRATLLDTILPQLLLSVRDTNDELVILSLKALANLVPILGGDIILGNSRRQMFSTGCPKGLEVTRGTSHKPYASSSGKKTSAFSHEAPTRRQEFDQHVQLDRTKEGKRSTFRDQGDSVDGAVNSDNSTVEDDISDTESQIDRRTDSVHQQRISTGKTSDNRSSPRRYSGDTTAVNKAPHRTAASMTTASGHKLVLTNSTKTSSTSSSVKPTDTSDDRDLVIGWDEWSVDNTHSTNSVPSSPNSSGNGLHSSLKNNIQRPSSRSMRSADSRQHVISDGLGSEYDIKQLDIKVSSPTATRVSYEPDFFADMAPEIKSTTADSLLQLLSPSYDEQNRSSSSRFAANADSQVSDGNGWDVDFSWEQT